MTRHPAGTCRTRGPTRSRSGVQANGIPVSLRHGRGLAWPAAVAAGTGAGVLAGVAGADDGGAVAGVADFTLAAALATVLAIAPG